MKKETVLIALVVAGVFLYLTYPHMRRGYAHACTLFGWRKNIITGTASKGNDSGGVLTSATNC
jgi:hypothetical protein